AGCGQERAAQAERDAYDLRLGRRRFLLRRCGWRAGEQGRRLVLSGSKARSEEHCRLRRVLEGRESASVNCVTLATQTQQQLRETYGWIEASGRSGTNCPPIALRERTIWIGFTTCTFRKSCRGPAICGQPTTSWDMVAAGSRKWWTDWCMPMPQAWGAGANFSHYSAA